MVVASFWLKPNSLKNLCSQIASQLACDVAIYSTLVVDSATMGCFQLDQVTTILFKRNEKLVVDFLISRLLPQSTLQKLERIISST
jgi:hypothetical protein